MITSSHSRRIAPSFVNTFPANSTIGSHPTRPRAEPHRGGSRVFFDAPCRCAGRVIDDHVFLVPKSFWLYHARLLGLDSEAIGHCQARLSDESTRLAEPRVSLAMSSKVFFMCNRIPAYLIVIARGAP